MDFKDYFSEQASDYNRYRPHYPAKLFEYLAFMVLSRKRAWDCATGNGQAAVGLAPFFEEVIATDASDKQIANAEEHDRITYAVAPAEKTAIDSKSIDLIVVAQALHWLDLHRFYEEVRRVSKSGGIIAVWSYSLLRISPEIDKSVARLYTDIVGPFWPPDRKMVDERYRTIPFPFEELSAPNFNMEAYWGLKHLFGYLSTWSAVQRFKERQKYDPIDIITEEVTLAWGAPESERRINWPINLRVGRVR